VIFFASSLSVREASEAHGAMRDPPEQVRSVVLDAPAMPAVHETEVNSLERPLDLVFEKCSTSASCNRSFPKLYSIIGALNEGPVELPVGVGCEPETAYVSGDRFAVGLQSALGSNLLIPQVPPRLSTPHLKQASASSRRPRLVSSLGALR